ncbi:respiratory burst oxidase homolog protein B-like [Apium graveolens]|uniref:respiratory burst oxidase homolog protein B-like n=1 Tax=Apium graveolens TaxID=4045 RepID=UPI003D7A67A0
MKTEESQLQATAESHGSSGLVAFKSARFKEESRENDPYIEITVDLANDSAVVHNIKSTTPDQEAVLLTTCSAKRPSLSSQLSSKLRQVSREIKSSFSPSKKITSSNKLVKHCPSGTAQALVGLRFMHNNVGNDDGWSEVEARFDQLSVDGMLPRSCFCKCIGMKESIEFMGELFDALARRRGIISLTVTKDELHEFWNQITDTSFDTRLQTFFDMVDKDADGRLTQDEIKEIITLSASANKLTKIVESADEYAALIMEELDPSNLGYVEMYNVEMLLVRLPNDSAFSATESKDLRRLISDKLVLSKDQNLMKRGYSRIGYFIHDNWKRIWVLCVWLLVCAGLFSWKFLEFKHKAVFDVMGYCVCIAKGSAETLKFNMALILLPVCRNTITWLRSRTKLGLVIPFDDNVNFHKVVSTGIAIGAGLHVSSHLSCDFPRLLHSTDNQYERMEHYFGHHRPNDYWWFVSGTEGWTGMTMLVLMTIAFVLANPWFRQNRFNLPKMIKRLTGYNAFWFSHHLFVIVYVLLIIHGTFIYLSEEWYTKTTWMYLAIPMILYGIERMIRAFRSGYRTVENLKVAIYPGNVISLQFTKPRRFNYASGQYIFVNCSKVSPFEWHPFSLTSAPGDDHLSVHIRTAGDWTSQLKTLLCRVHQPAAGINQSGLLREDLSQPSHNVHRVPKFLIDGPYGAPAQDYKQYDIVLLVGLGIGATPLISIVKDVLYHIKQQKEDNAGSNESRIITNHTLFNTTRVYFYWVTREEGSFEWFKNMMNEVAENDAEQVIEVHNYCTSVYEEGDARSALITMLQTFQHAKNGVDVVSGTRIKTHFARPNWRNVFEHVAVNHPNKRVGVFYSGARSLFPELRQLSHEFSRETATKFDFHKENF